MLEEPRLARLPGWTPRPHPHHHHHPHPRPRPHPKPNPNPYPNPNPDPTPNPNPNQPPEVASGTLLFSGFKVDVWAAGVSLYLLTTGQVPFEGASLISLFENIARGEYPVPPRLAANTALLTLVQGLLQRDEAARLSVGDALRSKWLEESDERDERWGEQLRAWVSEVRAASQGRHSPSVLSAIARMYGHDFHDGASPAPAGPAPAAPLVQIAQPGFPPSAPREVQRDREMRPEMQREIPPVAAAAWARVRAAFGDG